MERSRIIPVGLVLERRKIDNPWQNYRWNAVSVIVGAPDVGEWTLLDRGPDFERYHAATLPLPHHVMVNHVYALPQSTHAPHLLVLGATHMYKNKYITSVYYRKREAT